MGIVHAALAPVIVIGGVKPDLVLVAVVLVTTLAGFLPGVTWAFVAGVTANLLVGDPLGSVPLAMLAAATLVAGGGRLFGRAVWIYPVAATFVASVAADLVSLVLGRVVSQGAIGEMPFDLVIGAALLNAAIAAVLIVPARTLAVRLVPDELAAW